MQKYKLFHLLMSSDMKKMVVATEHIKLHQYGKVISTLKPFRNSWWMLDTVFVHSKCNYFVYNSQETLWNLFQTELSNDLRWAEWAKDS